MVTSGPPVSPSTTFVPLEDDIYIASYPRSGTTWLQMILYQLTTSGEMTFVHISQVVPFIDRCLQLGRDLSTLPRPGVFKTHLPYQQVAKWPGKYIYVARDGRDVLVSYYYFHQRHPDFKPTFSEFFDRFIRGQVQYGSWFRHVTEWQAHANDDSVLYLSYENLLTNFDENLRRIAAFCNVPLSPERFEAVKERSSFAFMKRHARQFDHTTAIVLEMIEQNARQPFIREGKSGSWKEHFTPEQTRVFDDAVRGTLAPTD